MGWSARFKEPILVAHGRQLATLADARAYLLDQQSTIPNTVTWENALTCLLRASKDGGPWIELARIALATAIADPNSGGERASDS